MNTLKLQLKQAGIRINDVAEATSYSRVTVHNTLLRQQFCQPVQDFVARALGITPSVLWGNDYAPTKKAIKKAKK